MRRIALIIVLWSACLQNIVYQTYLDIYCFGIVVVISFFMNAFNRKHGYIENRVLIPM